MGNANLCRKLSFSDSAEEYRADKEDLEDFQEVLEDAKGKKLFLVDHNEESQSVNGRETDKFNKIWLRRC